MGAPLRGGDKRLVCLRYTLDHKHNGLNQCSNLSISYFEMFHYKFPKCIKQWANKVTKLNAIL